MTASPRSILFPDASDPQSRYLREQEQAEEQKTVQRQGVDASQLSLGREVVRLNAKIDAQAAEIAQLRTDTKTTVDEAIEQLVARVSDWISRAAGRLDVKLIEQIAELRGETYGMVRALDPTAVRARATEKANAPFKFAGVAPSEPEPEPNVTVVSDDAVMVQLPSRSPFGGSGDVH